MFNPNLIKSPTRHNTFNTGEARKRAAQEYYRRAAMTPAQREREDTNTEAMVKCDRWWLENHDRMVEILGSHENAQREWLGMLNLTFNDDPKNCYIVLWEMLGEYEKYLSDMEKVGWGISNQIKLINDDIDLALENGDTARAHNLRKLVVGYEGQLAQVRGL